MWFWFQFATIIVFILKIETPWNNFIIFSCMHNACCWTMLKFPCTVFQNFIAGYERIFCVIWQGFNKLEIYNYPMKERSRIEIRELEVTQAQRRVEIAELQVKLLSSFFCTGREGLLVLIWHLMWQWSGIYSLQRDRMNMRNFENIRNIHFCFDYDPFLPLNTGKKTTGWHTRGPSKNFWCESPTLNNNFAMIFNNNNIL